MRFEVVTLGLFGATNAASIGARQISAWSPKTKDPHFFNLRIDATTGPLAGYAIRLQGGLFTATPYDRYWDPKLATFFVDDDTQLYTVSKNPLQGFIDSATGAVKYTKVGWIPPAAITTGFYHTGNNPLQIIDPSPSYLTWPSTSGIAFGGSWLLCPFGTTGQYELFVNSQNFEPQGVTKDKCISANLAAVNASPWTKIPHKPVAGDVDGDNAAPYPHPPPPPPPPAGSDDDNAPPPPPPSDSDDSDDSDDIEPSPPPPPPSDSDNNDEPPPPPTSDSDGSDTVPKAS